jgi:hypothetical protein
VASLCKSFIDKRDGVFRVDRVSSEPADRTNNATEQIIGLNYKIRAKTMRDFKSIDKSLGHCYLSDFLRGNEGVCDLRKVV